ncbi:MAG: TadE/TadG family type IV pilus assembly protein [Acidimicrobiia bacterium]
MKRRRDPERGATLVEAALVYPLLFLAIFAVVEFGFAFKDWLSVSHAAREGARAGATYGADPSADMLVLRDVEATLETAAIGAGTRVRVFDPIGGLSTTYTFSPGTGCTDIPACCDWTPCPDPFRPSSYVPPNWSPVTRDISAPFTDRIGVEVQFTHIWLTNFFFGTTDFTTATDFQIEPQIFDP